VGGRAPYAAGRFFDGEPKAKAETAGPSMAAAARRCTTHGGLRDEPGADAPVAEYL
jgi:hypothetical protein